MLDNVKEYNGDDLDNDSIDKFVKSLKLYYLPIRIFSGWLLFLVIMGITGFTYSLFTDESYNTGLFEVPAIKAFMMIISYGFLALLLAGVIAMIVFPLRNINKAQNLEFNWYNGYVSDVFRLRHKTHVWVDGKRVICLGFSARNYEELDAGYPVRVIILNKVWFAIPMLSALY